MMLAQIPPPPSGGDSGLLTWIVTVLLLVVAAIWALREKAAAERLKELMGQRDEEKKLREEGQEVILQLTTANAELSTRQQYLDEKIKEQAAMITRLESF